MTDIAMTRAENLRGVGNEFFRTDWVVPVVPAHCDDNPTIEGSS